MATISLKELNDNKLNLTGGTITGALNTKDINLATGSALKHGTNTIIDTTGKIWRAVYNDLAELFEKAEDDLDFGDVVICKNNKIYKATKEENKLLLGVVSDTYGFILGGTNEDSIEKNLNSFSPIGLTGRVKVKVTGDIKNGDLLTISNIAGVAETCKEYQPGIIIGKAVEEHKGNSIDRIWMYIMNI